jgi:hypothetical protein
MKHYIFIPHFDMLCNTVVHSMCTQCRETRIACMAHALSTSTELLLDESGTLVTRRRPFVLPDAPAAAAAAAVDDVKLRTVNAVNLPRGATGESLKELFTK